jgi:DNA modification methylase
VIQLINASAHHLPMLADGSVHCIVTSPPYWGLRKYEGEQGVAWPEVEYAPMAGLPMVRIEAMQCELGLEPTPNAFIGHLMLCLREWWRVLRADGTLWVNLGDSYQSAKGQAKGRDPKQPARRHGLRPQDVRVPGLKPKDLTMIPYRFALAAQAEGWWVRSDIVWEKTNSMPESVDDRPTKSHEYIYILTKSRRYFYDADAIREPLKPKTLTTFGTMRNPGTRDPLIKSASLSETMLERKPKLNAEGEIAGANKKSVWRIAAQGYEGAHFATFPEALVEPMILAGTSAAGCCVKCGTPWRRLRVSTGHKSPRKTHHSGPGQDQSKSDSTHWAPAQVALNKWEPGCKCSAGDPEPCTVLDPFAGSGTTGRVAIRLGRRAVLVDISREYLEQLVPERVSTQVGLAI